MNGRTRDRPVVDRDRVRPIPATDFACRDFEAETVARLATLGFDWSALLGRGREINDPASAGRANLAGRDSDEGEGHRATRLHGPGPSALRKAPHFLRRALVVI